MSSPGTPGTGTGRASVGGGEAVGEDQYDYEFLNKLASELYKGDECSVDGPLLDLALLDQESSSLRRGPSDENVVGSNPLTTEGTSASTLAVAETNVLSRLEGDESSDGGASGISSSAVEGGKKWLQPASPTSTAPVSTEKASAAEATASSSSVSSTSSTSSPSALADSSKSVAPAEDDIIIDSDDEDDVLADDAAENSKTGASSSSSADASSGGTRIGAAGGSSPSRDPSRPRRSPKVSAYARLVGKRRATVTMADDPTTQSSVFSWARDKMLGLVAGESPEQRKTRLRLSWYKQVLMSEIDVVDRARQHFANHGRDLAIEFEAQELQLQKWGLLNILPAFRIQAWARVSRSALLEDMSIVAERILKQRLARAQDVITLYASDSKGSRKHPLESYNAFCLAPDKVMAKEPSLTQLGHRLQRMDKVCTTSLHIFKTMLPELESRTFVQRRHMLADIMTRYAQLIAVTEPASLEESLGWIEFCDWFAARHREMADLEREYGNFVEDEREREGRLFRRWVTLTLVPDEMLGAASMPDGTGATAAEAGAGGGGGAAPSLGSSTAPPSLAQELTQQAIKPPRMSARSIVAFIRHFAVNVMAARYGVTQANQETLVALTESLVYRRINAVVLRYPSAKLQDRDVAWRAKCSICRFINPITFGVPAEYALGPGDAAAAAAGAGAAGGEGKATGETSDVKGEEGTASSATTAAVAASESGGVEEPHSVLDRTSSSSTIDFNLLEQSSSRDYEESVQSRSSSGKASGQGQRTRGARGTGTGMRQHAGKQAALLQEAEDLPARLSLSARMQTLPELPPGTYGAAYARASRVLSFLSVSITPREITHNLLLAIKWLLKDAVSLSGKHDYLGADLMFPILVLVLINAQIPCMHLTLHFLHRFGEYEVQGEAAYYVTCLEAAVAFVLRIEVPSNAAQLDAAAAAAASSDGESASAAAAAAAAAAVAAGGAEGDDGDMDDLGAAGSRADGDSGLLSLEGADKDSQLAETDMDKLSEWLRDQQTMEETIEILQNEGWMV